MISRPRNTVHFGDEMFYRAHELIERSAVCRLLERIAERNRGQGGRPASGIGYNIFAVLVAVACLLQVPTPALLSNIHRALLWGFTDAQRAQLGIEITPAALAQLADRRAQNAEYRRFVAWLNRYLNGIDSGFDRPARRIRNDADRAQLAARERGTWHQVRLAERLARVVMNRIVAASVNEAHPPGYAGDVVVDETIYDVAATGHNLGGGPQRQRAGAYVGQLYARTGGKVEVEAVSGGTTTLRADKIGFGFGVTALARAGEPGQLRAVLPLVTAIDVHPPSSGDPQAVAHVLSHHRLNGFDTPRTRSSTGRSNRLPNLAVDMGYNPKNGFADLLHQRQYTMLARYPKSHRTILFSSPPGARTGAEPDPGPVLGHGAFYCPAVANQLRAGPLVKRSQDLAENGTWSEHDVRLRALLPALMGTNSRIKKAAATAGRPAHGAPQSPVPKLDLICPAVQNRVRCPLKPQSMLLDATQAPTMSPTWAAEDKTCCAQSHVTVTLTAEQYKQYQPAVASSWEHMFAYEAYRSLSERVFSRAKSRYTTGLDKVNHGPRREPMLKLSIAIAYALTNLTLQDDPTIEPTDTITHRMTNLAGRLGRSPARIPPRT